MPLIPHPTKENTLIYIKKEYDLGPDWEAAYLEQVKLHNQTLDQLNELIEAAECAKDALETCCDDEAPNGKVEQYFDERAVNKSINLLHKALGSIEEEKK